jgi:hypothetical protein
VTSFCYTFVYVVFDVVAVWSTEAHCRVRVIMRSPDHGDVGSVVQPSTTYERPPIDLVTMLTPNEAKFYNDFGTVVAVNTTTVKVDVRMDSLTPAMRQVFGDQDTVDMYKTFPRHSIPSHLRSTRPHTALVTDQACLAAVWEGMSFV